MEHHRGEGASKGSWPRRPGPSRTRRTAPDTRGRGPGAALPGPADAPLPHAPVTMLEISRAVAAVPVPAKRARCQGDWLHALARDEDLAALRADRQENIRRVARVLARYASWRDRTTRPTRALILRLCGRDPEHPMAKSTWLAIRRWLTAHGWLGLVRQGWTPLLSASMSAAAAADTPNEAAIFVLTQPRRYHVKRQRPAVDAGQRESRPLSPERSEGDLSPARDLPRTSRSDDGSPGFVVAFLRSQVAELKRGPGKTLSDRAVLAISRPFLAARWSPNDLAHAIGHDPIRGKAHRTSLRGVRQPASWLAWRLALWTADPDQAWKSWHACGRWNHDAWPVPAPSPAQRALDAAAADRAALAKILPGPAPDEKTPGGPAGPGSSTPSAEYRAARAALQGGRHAT